MYYFEATPDDAAVKHGFDIAYFLRNSLAHPPPPPLPVLNYEQSY